MPQVIAPSQTNSLFFLIFFYGDQKTSSVFSKCVGTNYVRNEIGSVC